MSLFKGKKIDIDTGKLPFHIAFIIDGNGRWAKKRGLSRSMGHRQGVQTVKETVSNCYDLGIKELSFFCFSTENWNRPKEEIEQLFSMLREFVNEDITSYVKKGVKLMTSGDVSALPDDLQKAIERGIKETENCSQMVINICINYGGRDDILRAVNACIESGERNVDAKKFEKYLYTSPLSDPDLVIRTSGELRISNFMLYQMAYSELYFTDTYWPDFDKNALLLAISNFQKRNRRFGKIQG